MTLSHFPVLGLAAVLMLGACNKSQLDWDLRGGPDTLDTSDAARQATGDRPQPDPRGVISYPGYQVVVARDGDTVGSVASRVGVSAAELAQFNALNPAAPLRNGEILALPTRVASAQGLGAPTALGGAQTGAIIGQSTPQGGAIDVTSIATTALDRVPNAPAAATPTPAKPAAAKPASGSEPARHQVKRGETAFQIARLYNVSARSLAEWNGLGPDLEVREGQFLIIPTANGTPPVKAPAKAAAAVATTQPGAGTPTPQPPSSKKPLPDEDVAAAKAAGAAKAAPASPDLGEQSTAASNTRFAMPVSGKIIRGYVKKKNDGIDIAAAAGTAVKAAADGTVAAVTKDTAGTPIVVIRHANNLLTVYAGVDGLKVQKGSKVSRGQTIAVVRKGDPAFVHFEVRKGVDSLDPMTYLQ